MISANSKFPLRTSFLAFKKVARKLPSDSFLLYTSNHSPARLGVVVPKKVNKLATTRNWLKRLTFDILWPLIQDQNLDAVVVYKPLPLTKSEQTRHLIVEKLNHLLKVNN